MALQEFIDVRRGSTRLSLKSDIRGLAKELKKFGATGVPKANVRAMNSALRASKTAAKRTIAEQRFLKAAQAEAGLTMQFASINNQVTVLKGRGKMLPLTGLKTGVKNAKQLSLGTKATVAKGKRPLIRGAFIARMKSGHVGVFVRTHEGGGPNRVDRLPIQEQVLPSIAHTLTNDESIDKVRARYDEVYSGTLVKQLGAAITRANRRIKS